MASGKNPAQKPSRVTRAPVGAKPATDGRPRPSNADLAENRAQNRGAGPTKVGDNTPFPPHGPDRTSAPRLPAGVRDVSVHATGRTINERVTAVQAVRSTPRGY